MHIILPQAKYFDYIFAQLLAENIFSFWDPLFLHAKNILFALQAIDLFIIKANLLRFSHEKSRSNIDADNG